MNQQVAVTGASGFVGRALARHLHRQEHVSVLALTRRPQEVEYAADTWHLHDLEKLRATLTGVDVLVHAAGLAHSPGASEAQFRSVNCDLTVAVAEQAAAADVSRFVFLSSIGVNGSATGDKPFEESDQPRPSGPYAKSKHEAERGLIQLAAETGMEVVVVRPPLIYGPGAPGNFMKLVRAVDRGIPLPFGRATQNRRSYVAVENLVSILDLVSVHPAAANQTFLVADDETVSTAALVRRIAAARGVPARLVPAPVGAMHAAARAVGRPDAAQRLLGDLQVNASKAREVLAWHPSVTMDQQLARLAK